MRDFPFQRDIFWFSQRIVNDHIVVFEISKLKTLRLHFPPDYQGRHLGGRGQGGISLALI